LARREGINMEVISGRFYDLYHIFFLDFGLKFYLTTKGR
jgi:hypothetical protein